MSARPLHPRQEAARRLCVRLVGVVYALLILEGVLRKWLLPDLQQALYFVRDPFAIAAIAVALRSRLLPQGPVTYVVGGICVGLSLMAGYQVAADGYPPLAAVFGLRLYCLSMCLMLVVAATFTRADLLALVRWTLISVVPMAVLVGVQYLSPQTAPINKNVGDGEIFTVARGIVRATGTFSFGIGLWVYTSVVLVCLLIAIYAHAARRVLPTWGLVATAASLAVCLALSGSRGALTGAAIILVCCFVTELFKPAGRQRLGVLIGIPAIGLGLALTLIVAFPDMFDALSERHAGAARIGENFFARMLGTVGDSFGGLDRVPLGGIGIGSLNPGGAALAMASGVPPAVEAEMDRILFELGLVPGLIFMGLRWCMVAYLLVGGVRRLRQDGDAVTMIIWSLATMELLDGFLIMQGTINGFGFIFIGLALAALRGPRDGEAPVPPAAAGPRAPAARAA